MPMAPLFALLGVKAVDVLTGRFLRYGRVVILTVMLLVIHQGLHMSQQQGNNQDWEGIMNGTATYQLSILNPPISPEQRGVNIREACEYLETIRKDELVTGNHPHIDIYFGNLQDKETLARDWSAVKNLPLGTYFIWDQRLSELREMHALEKFIPAEWERVEVWENMKLSEVKSDPKKTYTTIIFHKLK